MARNFGKSLAIATIGAMLLGSGAIAVAQPGGGMMGGGHGPGMMGGGGGHGPGMMGGGGGPGPGMMGGGRGPGMMGGNWNSATYLDALKSQLGITSKEEPAWKTYADTVSGVSEQMQGLHQTMFESMDTASWQERRNSMNQMFEAKQQAMDTVHEAAINLLPALDPSQRTKAQSILPGLAFGPGMRSRG